jgi:hypothetical protein
MRRVEPHTGLCTRTNVGLPYTIYSGGRNQIHIFFAGARAANVNYVIICKTLLLIRQKARRDISLM